MILPTAARMIGGRCVEDNNRRSGLMPHTPPWSSAPAITLLRYPQRFDAESTYGLKVVAMGLRSDPVSDPSLAFLMPPNPTSVSADYDFSYGASAGSMTTFANAATGTLLYEEKSSATVIDTVSYYYYKGAYACGIGNWTANGSGQLTLYVGEGAVNIVHSGARTMMDGVVVTLVPEPSTLALLGLGGLALLIRRRK